MYVSDSSDSAFSDFICRSTDLVLYTDCVLHKRKYTKLLKDNVLAFIHPFYPEFIAGAFDDRDYTEHALIKTPEYASYKSVINGLINGLPSGWSSSLFTFPEVYHSWRGFVEKGLFSDVYFTLKGKGVLIDKDSLIKLRGKRVVVLGCYAEECIDTVIRKLFASGVNNVSVLSEGVMFAQSHPEGIKRSNDYLLERYMRDNIMVNVPVVKLESIISLR